MWVWIEDHVAVRATLRRATIEKIDDSGTQQVLKRVRGLKAEVFEDVYRAQQHGLSSHAPAGSEGLFLALSGRSDRIVALGFEHKDHRPKDLPEGATALYDASGKVLKFLPEETAWDAGGKKVVITNSPDIVIGTGSRYVRIRDGRVDLAIKSPSEDAPYRVATEAGYSPVIFGRMD